MDKQSKIYHLAVIPLVSALLLLLVPLAAFLISDEFKWSPVDFILAGILFFSAVFMFKLVTYKARGISFKLAAAVAAVSGLFLIWANLAVGIVGSEDNPINLIYFGVILLGIAGAFWSGLHPARLEYTMYAMAGAMLLTAAVLIGIRLAGSTEITLDIRAELMGILGIHLFFAIQFLISALLFRKADKELKGMEPK